MIKLIKRPLEKSQWLFEVAKFCHRITRVWSANYLKVLRRALGLCRRGKFKPAEAFRLGLFRTDFPSDEISKYISRKNLTKVQESLNPTAWAALTKEKSIFYRYCMALGIPIPKLYAIFFKRVPGWSYNHVILSTREDWKRFFANGLPAEFVVKPARGAYGRGVNIFSRTDEGFVDAYRRPVKAEDIYDAMFASDEDDSFLIQQRLRNHPELVRLSGTEALQTVRVITFVDRDGHSHILHAHFKPIVDQHVIDTFLSGLTGNIEAPVSLFDGVLKPANRITSSGAGIQTIAEHPRTGISFAGFQLPRWSEACSLVKSISSQFLPIRTIGWDIALTPNAPCVVEANIWWDPPNQHRNMDAILDALSS